MLMFVIGLGVGIPVGAVAAIWLLRPGR